ncbi:nuclear transport factor 2 family protein [Desulfovibrio inopinatus]|uniref:nuclear transport factor 2 family protein n=1 Tax=Desulfovibrio inopinatus TaxID=102109 RepID=UPI000419E638|nr:nuclear transport factor 2 family protein [Desulfovibrio inopinatus]
MAKKPIRTAEDFEAFFQAYNTRDWDTLFQYIHDDCIWNASEQTVQGRQAMEAYWCTYHAAIKETLGKPHNVVFGENTAYLEVPITMEFLEDGEFWGKSYPEGSIVEFWCADVYTFDNDGTISSCRVYTKFN